MGYCPRAGILGTESAAKECDGNRKGKMMEERRKNTMILYRNLRYQQLFDDMCSLLKPEEGGARPDAYACASQLIDLAVTYGFRGNLWHCFLAFCMDEDENGIWSEMKHYENALENSKAFNHRIRDRIVELSVSLENAESDQEFQDIVTEFYKEFGVGKFGLNKAFHIIMDDEAKQVDIEPITRVEHIELSDLVGYELQKAKLIENTEAFIEGRAANNCLLFGDSGTGKSSSIKAILNQYYDRGLRMIEVYKHQFRGLSDVLEQIKDRNYKFIIYMDDLSFEEYELEYKYLKAIIEGGLGIKPQNVLIYATSNRRHLIREKFSDKRELDDDLHSNDTVQEKLSLVARFGVTIYYGSPDKKEFQNIVRVLADKYHIHMPEADLLLEANKWELSHGGLSGRTATQFIANLRSKLKGESK